MWLCDMQESHAAAQAKHDLLSSTVQTLQLEVGQLKVEASASAVKEASMTKRLAAQACDLREHQLQRTKLEVSPHTC